MNFLKHFFSAAIFALTFYSVYAQEVPPASNENRMAPATRAKKPQKSPEEKAKNLTDTLSAVVNLNSDQYQKAYASNLKFVNEKISIKKSGVDLQTAKPQIIAAAKTRKSEIGAILSPEQVAKWEAWKKARKVQFKEEHPDMDKQQKIQQPILDDVDGM